MFDGIYLKSRLRPFDLLYFFHGRNLTDRLLSGRRGRRNDSISFCQIEMPSAEKIWCPGAWSVGLAGVNGG